MTGQRIRTTCRLGAFVILPLVLWLPVSVSLPGLLAPTPLHAAPPQPPTSNSDTMPGMGRSTEQSGDRLAKPVLPESPTQVDVGHSLYYFHCMPCHGDRGQGLTDEFREVWVEDHQNCWGRGCHTGKSEQAAFYIPKSVPPVSGVPQALGAFRSPEELFAFVQGTQPPQRPGALSESEYWALTAFLLHENGRLPTGGRVGPEVRGDAIVAATFGLVLILVTMAWTGRRRQGMVAHQPAAR